VQFVKPGPVAEYFYFAEGVPGTTAPPAQYGPEDAFTLGSGSVLETCSLILSLWNTILARF
jgi:hypothetical protein